MALSRGEKTMPLKWTSKLSQSIGYIIIFFAGQTYVLGLLTEPLERITSIALSSLGAIVALAALCFAVVPCLSSENDKKAPLYAGEKFFHSTLLIIQTLFLKYGADTFLSYSLIKSQHWLVVDLTILTFLLISGIGLFAVLNAAWGFDSLNKFFWQRHDERMHNQNISKSV
jgi:energy-converting hydrogenase Eha subunit C